MQEKKGISVIIPNYNGSILLPQILPPLLEALLNTKLPYEIIISDDCSTDGSVLFIKKNYPAIILLQNETNAGFSKTINKGIFKASFDYLLLLNSDVKLTPNYFKNLLHYFDDDDTFGVMGRIIGWDNDELQDGAKFPSFYGLKIKTSGNYVSLQPRPTDKLYSMYLSGANALISRKKLIELKGFDEIFSPFYIEDFELSLRAWRLGWKCYFENTAICRHQVSTSIKNKSDKSFINMIYNRNKMILHAIHLPKGKLFFWYIQLFGETILQIILGKIWFLTAVKKFIGLQKEIKQSKNEFYELSKLHNGFISVKNVTASILISLRNISIKKF